jgi:hypothetical protein
MNCRDFQNLIVIAVHGRLTADERSELDRHLSACQECAARHERFAPFIDLKAKAEDGVADVAVPDWEKSWAVISEKALPLGEPRSRFFTLVPRWVPAAAAVLLVFALGYFIGRGILVDSTTSGPGVASAVSADQPSPLLFANYADNLKPVLVNFLNRSDVRPPEELRALEREITRDMLSRTRLLRGLAAGSGDAALGDLLIDLEFILTSMANLAPGDTESAVHLERMIREKDIALRLRELASPATI